ncbi:MAG: diguanylate cyclase, partial [Sphingomonadaceae bacterium]
MRHFKPPPEAGSAISLAALKASEPLFEAAGLGTWCVDMDRHDLWWSRLTRRIHEVPSRYRPDLESAIRFYRQDVVPEVERMINEAVAQGLSWDRTYPAVTARGRSILLRSCGLTVRRVGRTRLVLGTCEDVTEETERARERERLALVLEHMNEAAIITDPDGITQWTNPAFERLTGFPSERFIGRKPGGVLQGPETDPETVKAIGAAIRAGQPFTGEILNYRADGESYWIELSIAPLRNAKGRLTGFVGIEANVTRRRQTETLLRDIIDSLPVAVSAYDRADRLLLFNRRKAEVFPRHAAMLEPGMPLEQVLRSWHLAEGASAPGMANGAAIDIDALIAAARTEVPPHEHRVADGRWLLSTARRSPSGNLIWVRTDITAQKQAELAARERASRDQLTGLLNRAGFIECLRMRNGAPGGSSEGCLVIFDLDHFKSVNDAYGHEAGDLLLRTIGRRVERQIRQADLAARLGGDEFAIFLPGLTRATAPDRIEALCSALGRVIRLGNVRILPTLSVGAAFSETCGTGWDGWLRRADRALYEAKRLGRNRVVFHDDRLAAELAERHRLAERLRRAMAAGQLTAALQPKLRLPDLMVTGFEALARWHDGERQIAPSEFVPVAEEHRLGERLGCIVMEQALAACARLRSATGRPLQASVNVTTAQLLAVDFVEQT